MKPNPAARIKPSWPFVPGLSKKQKALARKHGTPAEFAVACYECCPGIISMNEAAAAISKYNREWRNAK